MLKKYPMVELVDSFSHNQPQSGMALAYLMEKGIETVKQTTEEEYEAAVDAQIAQVEARGHVPLMTKEFLMEVFRYAKGLSQYDALDIVIALGNGVYHENYLRGIYGPGVIIGKAACPYCGGNHFYEDDDDKKRICADCDSVIDMEELNLVVGEDPFPF